VRDREKEERKRKRKRKKEEKSGFPFPLLLSFLLSNIPLNTHPELFDVKKQVKEKLQYYSFLLHDASDDVVNV
jgi:hypothetical protein